ncbi:lasso peptide biosynthesis B2 protein [Occultella glacieicola]|uniref:lasso peptide biosynthesis B2 protein n=1 Tax=Occultella glacieicola TaxID=2518684 RepID=UPI00140538C9|nr:lasso peptide biosynthesis B2 protein [Occultella glacieicola]
MSVRRPPFGEWPWIVAALALAVVAELGLRTAGLPRLARMFGTPLRTDDSTPAQPDHPSGAPVLDDRARRQVRSSRRVMRHWPFGDTCLRQALISGALLRRLGPELLVGVAKIDGQVRAHAWLEINGGILDPLGAAASYTPLLSPDALDVK